MTHTYVVRNHFPAIIWILLQLFPLKSDIIQLVPHPSPSEDNFSKRLKEKAPRVPPPLTSSTCAGERGVVSAGPWSTLLSPDAHSTARKLEPITEETLFYESHGISLGWCLQESKRKEMGKHDQTILTDDFWKERKWVSANSRFWKCVSCSVMSDCLQPHGL